MNEEMQQETVQAVKSKFCKHCGAKIPEDAVLCTACGRQVEELRKTESPAQQAPVINITQTSSNVNTNTNINGTRGLPRAKNKWVAFLLCLLFGYLGIHKFYEGKILLGILYIFTFGLFGIGWFVDTIALLFKPNPYYL